MPLAADEAAKLYAELRVLINEDAARRMKATQFGAETEKSAGQPGHADAGHDHHPPPISRRTSRSTAVLTRGPNRSMACLSCGCPAKWAVPSS